MESNRVVDMAQRTEHIDVAYVARLARLKLTDEEVREFQGQLDQILSYVDQIRKLDLTGIEPTSHARPLTNVLRKDEVHQGLTHETALSNAPQSSNGLFMVPKILE